MTHSAIMSVRITGNSDDAVKAFQKATTKAAAFGSFMGGAALKGVTALWDKVSSFGSAVMDMSDSTDKFVSTMNFAGIDTVQNMAVSGSGFTVGGDNTFVKQWERVSNQSNVDLVLVIGGVNDNNADCSAAVTQLLNAIKQKAPKATTYVFPVAGGLGMGLHEHHFALHTISHATLAQTATTNRRVVLMQGVHRWGQMIREDEADGYIHMKQAGYQKWAAIATRLIKNGQNTFWPTFARDLTVTPVSGDTLFDQTQRAHGRIERHHHPANYRALKTRHRRGLHHLQERRLLHEQRSGQVHRT